MEWAALLRAAVAVLLGSAALVKAGRFSAFAAALRAYELIPRPAVTAAAAVVIAAEACAATALVLGLAVPLAMIAGALLFAAFAAALALTLRRGDPVECGCLGGLGDLRADWFTAGLNAVLAAACAAAATTPVAALPLPSGGESAPDLTLVAWLGGSALAVTYWLTMYARTVLRTVDEALEREAT